MSKKILATLVLAVLASGMLFAGNILAAPVLQAVEPEAIVDRIELSEPEHLENDYVHGEEITFTVSILDERDPDDVAETGSNLLQDYVISMDIRKDNSSKALFTTNGTPSENKAVSLEPEKSDEVEFKYVIPGDAEEGRYEAEFSVRNPEDLTDVLDDLDVNYDVESGVDLFLSSAGFDFGNVEEDDSPISAFAVANSTGIGTLQWRVTDWPDDFLELMLPAINPDNPNESVTVTGPGSVRFRVKKSVLQGTFTGDIVVDSNGGELDFSVRANVMRNPGGELTSARLSDTLFSKGDTVTVEYQVENSGEVDLEYRVIFTARNASGAVVFNSNAEDKDALIFVEKGDESPDTLYQWMLPFSAPSGDYTLTMELRAAQQFDLGMFGGQRVVEFEVRKGPEISISPTQHGFGTLVSGEEAEAEFEIENTGRGQLTWQVDSWPDWVELLSPTSSVSGDGTIRVQLEEGLQGGTLTGVIEISSNAGPRTIQISANVLPPPTPTISVATVLARRSTPTPSPTPVTPTSTPTPTPTPSEVLPSIFNGDIEVLSGQRLPSGAQLVARVNDYESFPAGIEGQSFFNLVVAPPNSTYEGELIEFFLDGEPVIAPDPPIFYFPGITREISLRVNALPGPAQEATRIPPIPTVQANTPTPTVTSVPPTITPTSVPPTATPTQTQVPAATATATTQSAAVQTPTAQSEQGEEPSAGSCNFFLPHAPITAGLGNFLLLIAPLGLLAGLRVSRRKDES